MRVLHISALPVWSMEGKGGMPSLQETLNGHVRAGHKVTLILPEHHLYAEGSARVQPPTDAPYETFIASCPWLPWAKRIRFFAKRHVGNGNATWLINWVLNRMVYVLMTWSLFAAAVRVRWRHKRRFDLVYAHNQYAALAGYLVRVFYRVPNVTRLYGTFLADLMDRPLLWLRYTTSWLGYKVPHSLLICTNDGTRGDEVARRLGVDLARFRFWQNGVDRPDGPGDATRPWAQSMAPSHLRSDSRWIFTCSRLSYWKRIDRILRALRHCRDAGCDAQLLVAGDGPERESLAALTRELGLESDVVWLGPVSHGDIWRFMRLADVFVITNDVTNRCNPLYEAIRAGTPIVSIYDPSTADLLEDGGNALLADPSDPEGLGQCMLRVCTDAPLADRMRAAQRVRSDRLWTWQERMTAETDELNRLVRGSSPKETAGARPDPARNPA